MARLGAIGSSNEKTVSGVYNLDENSGRVDAQNTLSSYAFDNVFNALTSSGTVEGITFNRAGTRLYTVTRGTRLTAKITQWNLSTPFDLTTLSYQAAKDLIIGDWDINPTGLQITDDGTKLYFSGYAGATVFSLTLATPFDLATATVDVKKFYVGTQSATSTNVVFGDSGTKMYVLLSTGTVFQYTLSTAWNVSTAAYASKSLVVSTQDTAPLGMFFKSDGKKLYITGTTSDSLYSYTLGTGWDLATATADYATPAFISIATQAATLNGREDLYIGSNGTKLYILAGGAAATDTVFQYTLGTAWSIATATYDNKSISVNTQDSSSEGLYFNDTGTRMYVVGNATDAIYTYTLSVAWDVSTATADYVARSALVSAQTTVTSDVFIGDSGTKMYVLAGLTATTDTVYQYTLSTPNDVTTATYASKSFVVNTQDTSTSGIFFKSDGSKMYITGDTQDNVLSYTLSTPWDVSTASTDVRGGSFSVATQTTTCSKMAIGSSGTKMYILSGGAAATDTIFQYTLGTANDITTATYDNKSLVVNNQDATSQGIFFKSDGTKLFMIGSTSDAIFSYTLSTPWDISTGTSDHVTSSYLYSTQTATSSKVAFGNNGTKMYVLSGGAAVTDTVFQYTLATAWDVTTATYDTKSFVVNTQDATSQGLFFKSDGTKMYVIGSTNDYIYAYTLSTPWDVSTAVVDFTGTASSYLVSAQTTTTSKVTFGDNGLKMYVLSGGAATTDTVFQYTLGTAWDVTTASYASKSLVVNTQDATSQGLFFKSDGTKLYMIGSTQDAIFSYTLSTAWDISTATADFSAAFYSHSVVTSTTSRVVIGDNGTKVYVLAGGPALTDTVYQFSLGTAWDVTTASYTSKTFSVNAQDATSQGIFFKNDGLIMYMVGSTNDAIYQYNLSVAWDISTASYSSKSFSIATRETEARGLYISPDGVNVYIGGQTNDNVIQFSLSTPWDITTATFVRASASIVEATQTGLFFKDDGLRMYVVGTTSQAVREYTLTVAWDVSTIALNRVNFVGMLDTLPTSVFFRDNGTRMYISGDTADRVYQLNLSEAWNSASNVGRFYVGDRETEPRGMHISPDGLNLYVGGQTGDNIVQYLLSTAWDISSANYVRVSASIVEATQTGIYFKSDGLTMYVIGNTNQAVREYSLSVAWDVSTISLVRTNAIGNLDTVPTSITFRDDGTRMYISGDTNDRIFQLNLNQSWNSASVTGRFYVGDRETEARSMYISSDGLNLYIGGQTNDNVIQYLLNSAWDISTANYVRASASIVEATQTGLFFKSDGTRMYVVGTTSQNVREYALSVAWNLSTLTLTRVIYVGFLDTAPISISFRDDGTRAFIGGDTADRIYQFNLTDSWSFNIGRYYIGDRETEARAMYISPNGLNMYVAGQTGDNVVQYLLGAAWDISTASFVRTSATITEATQTGLYFSTDGLKMFIVGTTGLAVREYDLTVAWDVSTIVFNKLNAIAGQLDTLPVSLTFSDDGLKMYVLGDTGDLVWQRNLATAWNCNSVQGRFYIGDRETTIQGMYISPDGLNMYIGGQTNDNIIQYALSTAWDTSTGSYVRASASITEATQTGIYFSSDGLKAFVVGTTGQTIREYSLSVAWDVSTLAFVKLYPLAFLDTAPAGINFSTDGTRIYIPGDTNDRVYELRLGYAWNSTSVIGRFNLADQELTATGMYISPDGLNMYVTGQAGTDVNQYLLSTAWDIASASFVRVSAVIGDAIVQSVQFSTDGTRMFVSGTTNQSIRQFNLSTPWNVSTAVFNRQQSIAFIDTSPTGIYFRPDGSSVYLLGNTNGRVTRLPLSENWNVTSVTGRYYLGYEDTDPFSIYITSDGLNLFVNGRTGTDINQYSLSTAWDTSTATFVRVSAAVGETLTNGMFFKDDGTAMYIMGNTSKTLREYSLSTPWNVSTLSFVRSISTAFETALVGLYFKDDGTQFYFTGQTNDTVYQVELGTAWNVSTRKGYHYMGTQDTTPRSIYLSQDGTRLYMCGSASDQIRQYTLSTPYDVTTATLANSFAFSEALGMWVSDLGETMFLAAGSAGTTLPGGARVIRQASMSTPFSLATASLSTTEIVGLYGVTGAITEPWDLFVTPDRTKLFVLSSGVQGLYQFSLKFL